MSTSTTSQPISPPMETEFIKFRMFLMPCCMHQLCWVNPRLPNFCPECGASCMLTLKNGEHTIFADDNARLTHVPMEAEQLLRKAIGHTFHMSQHEIAHDLVTSLKMLKKVTEWVVVRPRDGKDPVITYKPADPKEASQFQETVNNLFKKYPNVGE